MWEYNKVSFQYKNGNELVEKLNEYGKDNWEIISIDEKKPEKFGKDWECVVLMKRKKQNNDKIIL